MTYLLNGIPLTNPSYKWRLRATSQPLAELVAQLGSVNRTGRHGLVSPMPGVLDAPVIRLVVRTPRAHLRTLESLLRGGGTLTSTYETGSIDVEFASFSVESFGSAQEIVDLGVSFRVPDGGARGPVQTSAVVSVASASQDVSGLFPGLSLEVQDAIVRVKGAFSGLQVTDSGGSWFTYGGTLTAAQWLRFESATGRAYITATDVWTGGTEVSGDIDFGGDRGLFEIAPRWTTDPATRAGQLTVATASRTSASVQVRGKAAHLV